MIPQKNYSHSGNVVQSFKATSNSDVGINAVVCLMIAEESSMLLILLSASRRKVFWVRRYRRSHIDSVLYMANYILVYSSLIKFNSLSWFQMDLEILEDKQVNLENLKEMKRIMLHSCETMWAVRVYLEPEFLQTTLKLIKYQPEAVRNYK